MYNIKLTIAELHDLAWAVNRGYFPKETFDAMSLIESDRIIEEEFEKTNDINANSYQFTYEIPENKAWAITEQRTSDPHSLYSCLGGDLLNKLVALENSII